MSMNSVSSLIFLLVLSHCGAELGVEDLTNQANSVLESVMPDRLHDLSMSPTASTSTTGAEGHSYQSEDRKPQMGVNSTSVSSAKREEEYQFVPVLTKFGAEERSRSLHLVGVMMILTIAVLSLLIHSASVLPKRQPQDQRLV